jgi:Zn-dependent protease with chaperone function
LLIVLLLYVAVGHSGLLYYGSLASTTLIAASAVPIAVLAVESRVVSEGARATVRPLGSSEEWVMGVLGELRHVCSGLGGAEVLVEETGNINASIDQSAKPVRVVITRGALEKLTEEELKAMLAHECGHLDTGFFHRVTGIVSLQFLLGVVTALVLAVVIGVLSTNTVLALLEPVETPRLFTSTLTAVLALFTTFISVIYQRMLGELVADVKSVEITGGNVLETVLSKIEQVNKPADIKGLLRRHLGHAEFLFSPIVRALLLINDVHPLTQLRILVIKEQYQRRTRTRNFTMQ